MQPTIAQIQAAVAAHFRIGVAELMSHRRNQTVALPRQIAMYLSRELTPHSLPAIARSFNRDHTTVWHACREIPQRASRDGDLAMDIADLRMRLTAEISPVAFRDDSRAIADHGSRWMPQRATWALGASSLVAA